MSSATPAAGAEQATDMSPPGNRCVTAYVTVSRGYQSTTPAGRFAAPGRFSVRPPVEGRCCLPHGPGASKTCHPRGLFRPPEAGPRGRAEGGHVSSPKQFLMFLDALDLQWSWFVALKCDVVNLRIVGPRPHALPASSTSAVANSKLNECPASESIAQAMTSSRSIPGIGFLARFKSVLSSNDDGRGYRYIGGWRSHCKCHKPASMLTF